MEGLRAWASGTCVTQQGFVLGAQLAGVVDLAVLVLVHFTLGESHATADNLQLYMIPHHHHRHKA